MFLSFFFFFFQAEDGIRDRDVTGVQTCALPIFFHRLVGDLDKTMGDAYPELRASKGKVEQVLRQEEERFAETLENGMAVLESALASGEKLLDGDTVFRLYDTYGFPVDLTAAIGRQRGVRIDMAG